MLLIESLSFALGDLPVTISQVELQRGTINVIAGKNGAGKTRFCESLASCQRANHIYLQNIPLQPHHFAYLTEGLPHFFDCNGNEVLTSYDQRPLRTLVADLVIKFKINLSNPVSSYSASVRKILQFLWVLSFEADLYVFDGLFDFLDHDNTAIVRHALNRLREEGRIVIITSRDLVNIGDMADEVYHLNNRSLDAQSRMLGMMSSLIASV